MRSRLLSILALTAVATTPLILSDLSPASALGKLGPGERRCFSVSGSVGDAALVNLTPVEADGPGFGVLVSSGVPAPSEGSNVNFGAGTFDPNVAVAPIGADGKVCYVNAVSSVHLIADHLGSVDSAAFTPATPTGVSDRKLDTRDRGSKVQPARRELVGVEGEPGDVAIVNLTPVEAEGPGFGLLTSSSVTSVDDGSNVNFGPGTFDPNLGVAQIGSDRRVAFFGAVSRTHLIADHLGNIDGERFATASATGEPSRKVDTRTELSPTTTTTTTTTTTVPRPVCDPSYPTVCIPPPPPDLNCGDIPFRNFVVLQPDPHNFDGNNDGIGCVG